MNHVTIEHGSARHLPQLHALVRELAAYERSLEKATLTLEQLEEDHAAMHFDFFVAMEEGEVIGMALYYHRYSTWTGLTLHLEDLFVKESHRGSGIGKGLFEAVLREAAQRNVARMEWEVLRWNEPALGFYRRYNSSLDGEWVLGKLSADQLKPWK